MLSRIFWVLLTGVALVAGTAMQGNLLFGIGDGERAQIKKEAAIEARVERAIERRLEHAEVVGADGQEVDLNRQTKQELASAVSRLVTAQTELALAGVWNEGEAAVQQARARRDSARADVDRLKDEIRRQERLSRAGRDALRTQIREDVRETVREAVRG